MWPIGHISVACHGIHVHQSLASIPSIPITAADLCCPKYTYILMRPDPQHADWKCVVISYPFHNSLYQQVHGIAMGSPVSVVVADLVMEDVESRALTAFPSPPRFWKRYVDDTCCALRTDSVENFHCHLNSSIQFTL